MFSDFFPKNVEKYGKAWDDAHNMAPARGVLDK